MKEKVKLITVTPNPCYVIWEQDLENIVKDTAVIVDSGCTAFYIVDGKNKNTLTSGRWLINSKDEIRAKSILQLICVTSSRTFEIRCGVGMIPFKDFDLNVETTVGAHGECKIRITQPWLLYSAFGKAQITADEIDAYVKNKMCEIMSSRLSELLQHYDYNAIVSQQSTLASDLQERFTDELLKYGLEVVSFALAGIMFPEDYQERRRAIMDAANRKKEEKEERRQREREQRAELDTIVAIANATSGLRTDAPVTPAAPAAPANNVNQPVKYCPRCGTKMDASAKFCPGCGKEV